MKQNKTKLYAKALAEVIFSGKVSEKKIIENFSALLVKSGQQKKAKEILSMAEDLLLQKQGKRKIVFSTARKMSAGQKKILDNFADKGDLVKEEINPGLIAGIKIIINNAKQFDGSLQSKLSRI